MIDDQVWDNVSVQMEKSRCLYEQAKQSFIDTMQLGANELFEQYPELISFSWIQYTPYYCDGTPCYFCAETDSIVINEGTDSEEELCVIGIGEKRYSEKRTLAGQLGCLLSEFDDEDLKLMFGDHAKILIKKTGIEVLFYEHE